MKKENQKFTFQVLTFGTMIVFALTGHEIWGLTMLFVLYSIK